MGETEAYFLQLSSTEPYWFKVEQLKNRAKTEKIDDLWFKKTVKECCYASSRDVMEFMLWHRNEFSAEQWRLITKAYSRGK